MDETTTLTALLQALDHEAVERYIRDLPFHEPITDEEITLVVGNIRGFAEHLRLAAGISENS